MIGYLDSSVVLRRVLGQAASLREWERLSGSCTSMLTRLECRRTLDRARLDGSWRMEALRERQLAIDTVLNAGDELEISAAVLTRAGQPLPVTLGTLDAIHLSSALLWRDQHPDDDLVFATHDRALGRAAQTMGLVVIGIDQVPPLAID